MTQVMDQSTLINWRPSGSVFTNQVSPHQIRSHGVNTLLVGYKLPYKPRQSSNSGALSPYVSICPYNTRYIALSETLPYKLPHKSRQSSKSRVLGLGAPIYSHATGER